jgi:RNA polymerase sigma-70 factor, ECF subfamily
VNSSGAMSEASRREVRAGLEPSLARLWRYALVLSKARDVADDLVQATCLRAIERADQFVPGTRVDRWLFVILRSIWLNEIRSRRIREGGGFFDAEETLTTDGAHEIETNITASAVLRAIDRLPEAQRETVLLVYGEGYSYAEAAAALGVPIGTIMSRLASGRAALAKLK